MIGNHDVQDLLNIAREKFIAGDYAGAETILQQLLIKNGRIPEIFQMLATIYYDRGQFTKAIKAFQRALVIDPGFTDASVGLSIILNDLGRYEEGKRVFQEAQNLLDRRNQRNDPYANEKLSLKHQELANLYFTYHRYGEALEQLYKASRLSPRPDIYIKVSDCYLKMNQPEKAVKELRAALQEYPNHSQIKDKLASIKGPHLASPQQEFGL